MPSTLWLPDAPPATAGALDDEFADASGGVPNGWTEVDHGSHMTVSEDAQGLIMTQATHANNSVSGIYKADPTGNITIWAKVGLSAGSGLSAAQVGLALWEDATSSTGNVVTFCLAPDGSTRVETRTAYDAVATATDTEQWYSFNLPTHMYLRIRRTTATYTFDASLDGKGWQQQYSTGALGFVPAQLGPCMWNVNTGLTVVGRLQFFRSIASDVTVVGRMSGDRVRIRAA